MNIFSDHWPIISEMSLNTKNLNVTSQMCAWFYIIFRQRSKLSTKSCFASWTWMALWDATSQRLSEGLLIDIPVSAVHTKIYLSIYLKSQD